ncbi:MAG: hypothetical protein JW732_07050 [Dehalococcoidia bacterium]|nr:hypothetical protein [Dehalococcoidia bacterium]
MRKKTVLIVSITLTLFLALLPGGGSVLADDEPHYYAYGELTTGVAPGVSGSNYVYDNEVDNHFVAEFVTVILDTNPKKWIEVGWLKSTSPYPTQTKFYVGWKTTGEFEQETFENAQYNTSHDYRIYKYGCNWLVKIDGDLKKTIPAEFWLEGFIMAQSESQDSADPPVNEMEGYLSDLRYYNGSNWILWYDIDTGSDDPLAVFVRQIPTNSLLLELFPNGALTGPTGVSLPGRRLSRQSSTTSRVNPITATWFQSVISCG